VNCRAVISPWASDPQTDVPVFQSETTNLWKEEYGASFFARSVQLKCFQQITANTVGIPVPPATAGAITWLQNALPGSLERPGLPVADPLR